MCKTIQASSDPSWWGEHELCTDMITYLDHDESSFAKSRTLHRESGRCPGISTREIILIISHRAAKFFRSESWEKIFSFVVLRRHRGAEIRDSVQQVRFSECWAAATASAEISCSYQPHVLEGGGGVSHDDMPCLGLSYLENYYMYPETRLLRWDFFFNLICMLTFSLICIAIAV